VSNTKPGHWRGYGAALLAAVSFSGKAVVIKLLYRHGIDAVDAIALRMLLSWPLFAAMAWWAGRTGPPLTRRDGTIAVVLGFTGYYASSMLDFLGLQYISASLERLILFVYPTMVALIVAARGHRAMTRLQIIALATSYGGVLLVFGREALGSLETARAGVLWGGSLVLGSAAFYAAYLVVGGAAVGRLGALRLTGLAGSVACALCVAQFCLLRPWSAWLHFTAPVWELSLFNAVACTALPTWMVMRAMAAIGPAHTAQVAMIGPVSTLLLAAWLLDEPLTATVLLGTGLVLAGVALIVRPQAQAVAAQAP